MPDIKINLRKLRVELNVSQKEFAQMISMPTSTYRKKENGETQFTLEEAYKIAKIANKPIDQIFLPNSDQIGQLHSTKI